MMSFIIPNRGILMDFCLLQILIKHLINWNITLSSQPLLNLDLAKILFNGSGPFCGMAVVVS